MSIYEGNLFTKNIEKHILGKTEIAQKEFDFLDSLLRENDASRNIDPLKSILEETGHENILSILCRYFYAKGNQAANIAAKVDVSSGIVRINVKYNPDMKPEKLLNEIKELYGKPMEYSV